MMFLYLIFCMNAFETSLALSREGLKDELKEHDSPERATGGITFGTTPSLSSAVYLDSDSSSVTEITTDISTNSEEIFPITIHLSGLRKSWKESVDSCKVMKLHFCGSSDVELCLSKIKSRHELSMLPNVFTAWTYSYLFEASSVIYLGCVEISYDSLQTFNIHPTAENSIESCVLNCPAHTEHNDHIGFNNGSCFCLDNSFVNPLTTYVKYLANTKCIEPQLQNTSTAMMHLYKTLKHTDLSEDYCPCGFYLGNKNVRVIPKKCKSEFSFYCESSNKIFTGTWTDAKRTCEALKSRLLYANELKSRANAFAGFWIDGINVKKLLFNPNEKADDVLSPLSPSEPERCTALQRTKEGKLIFKVLNCSDHLYSLCEKGSDLETSSDFTSKNYFDKTSIDVDSLLTKYTSTRKVPIEIAKETGTTTEHGPYLTEQNPTYTESSTGNTLAVKISVALGVTVVVAIIVIAIAVQRRKQNKVESAEIRRKSQLLFRAHNSNYIDPSTIDGNMMRYLPSVMGYPSGYDVDDLKGPDDVSRDTIEVDVLIHSNSNITEHSQELDVNNSEDEYIHLNALGNGSLTSDTLNKGISDNSINKNNSNRSSLFNENETASDILQEEGRGLNKNSNSLSIEGGLMPDEEGEISDNLSTDEENV